MTKQERQWRPVVGFEDLYEVSNLGEVKSLAHTRAMPNGGIRIYQDTILKNRTIGRSIYNTGWRPYQQVVLYLNGKTSNKMIHRLVAEAFIPNHDGKHEVNHIDNNPKNNTVENLEWATASENMKHCAAMNRDKFKDFGERMRTHLPYEKRKMINAKITQSIADEIRSLYIPNIVSLNDLAVRFKVSKKTVLLIIQNKTWRQNEKVNY